MQQKIKKKRGGGCEKIKKKVAALRVTTFEQPTRRYTRGPVRVYQPSPTASRAGNVNEQRSLRGDRFKNTTCASGPATLLDYAQRSTTAIRTDSNTNDRTIHVVFYTLGIFSAISSFFLKSLRSNQPTRSTFSLFTILVSVGTFEIPKCVKIDT